MTNPSFGFLLPTRQAAMSSERPDVAPLLALGERAEALGFDSVWAGDSVLARPRLDALTTLAALAARTRRVRLGTAVLLPALRQPVVLANEAAGVDLLSGGRLVIGAGVAARSPAIEAEFEACGVSYARRIGIFEECVEIVKRLWAEPEVSFEGRHFSLRGVALGVRPRQRPGVPLWLTGPASTARRRLLRLGDGWISNPASPAVFERQWRDLRDAADRDGLDAGPLHRCAYTTLAIADDPGRAAADARAFIEAYYAAPYEAIASHQGVCAGTPEQCAGWLRGLVAGGAQTIIVRLAGPDQGEQLERCAAEVLPRAAG